MSNFLFGWLILGAFGSGKSKTEVKDLLSIYRHIFFFPPFARSCTFSVSYIRLDLGTIEDVFKTIGQEMWSGLSVTTDTIAVPNSFTFLCFNVG